MTTDEGTRGHRRGGGSTVRFDRMVGRVKNPWSQLPASAPYILPEDHSIIERFNARYAYNWKFQVQRQLLAEPFIGDPSSRVYLLGLNPGYDREADDAWHANPVYCRAIINNLNHRPAEFPFYFLDPCLKDAPGSKWWRLYLKWLINDVGIETLAQNVFYCELFPYHSKKYKPVPKVIAPKGLPSSRYTVSLVHQTIEAHRLVVVTRAFSRWCKLVPELQGYRNLLHLRTTASIWLSPN